MPFDLWAIGCCGCGAPVTCEYYVCLQGCSGSGGEGISNLPGGAVTIYDDKGVQQATGVTDSTGCVTLTVTGVPSNNWKVQMDYQGQTAYLYGWCSNYTFNCLCFQVLGCAGRGLPGANVQVDWLDGTSNNWTTDSNGNTPCKLVNDQFGQLWTDLTVSYPGFMTYDWATCGEGGDGTGPYCGQLGNNYQSCCDGIVLTPDENHVCCQGCNTPICRTLALTDSVMGGVNVVYGFVPPGYEGSFQWGNTWNGIIHYAYPGACGCPARSVDIIYVVSCDNPAQGLFYLDAWFAVGGGGGPCFAVASGVVGPCPGADPPAQPGLKVISPGQVSGSCNPLELVYQETLGCDCYVAVLGDLVQPCGCQDHTGDGTGALWGSGGSVLVTFTVTDNC